MIRGLDPVVVIYASNQDVHANAVEEIIRRRFGARAEVVDLSWFPTSMALTSWAGAGGDADIIELPGGRSFRHDRLRAVWWRRPQQYRVHGELRRKEHREFALNEIASAFHGVWARSRCLWMNPILRDQAASRKLYQLSVGRAVGLRIPTTLVTSNPAEARRFFDEQGGELIYKAFLGTKTAWRETRKLKPEETELFDNLRHAPAILQELIRATVDLRITVVGGRIFAAQIDSQAGAYPYDVRMDMTVSCRPHELDPAVGAKLLRLMDALELEYGAIDMRLTPEGEYVFLEINPAGQYLYIEKLAGLPISEAVAEHLLTGTPRIPGNAAEVAHATEEARQVGVA